MRYMELVEAARERIRETDPAAVRHRIERGDRFHLVDVREDGEWARGRIPGAKHIGRGVLELAIERAVPDADAEIVLYCGGGHRSALAAESLGRMGYANIWSMEGGFSGWIQAGYPIEAP